MSRPQHLSVPNTPEGIRRINQEQNLYDEDPDAYEAREQAHQEAIEGEAMARQAEEDQWQVEQDQLNEEEINN